MTQERMPTLHVIGLYIPNGVYRDKRLQLSPKAIEEIEAFRSLLLRYVTPFKVKFWIDKESDLKLTYSNVNTEIKPGDVLLFLGEAKNYKKGKYLGDSSFEFKAICDKVGLRKCFFEISDPESLLGEILSALNLSAQSIDKRVNCLA